MALCKEVKKIKNAAISDYVSSHSRSAVVNAKLKHRLLMHNIHTVLQRIDLPVQYCQASRATRQFTRQPAHLYLPRQLSARARSGSVALSRHGVPFATAWRGFPIRQEA